MTDETDRDPRGLPEGWEFDPYLGEEDGVAWGKLRVLATGTVIADDVNRDAAEALAWSIVTPQRASGRMAERANPRETAKHEMLKAGRDILARDAAALSDDFISRLRDGEFTTPRLPSVSAAVRSLRDCARRCTKTEAEANAVTAYWFMEALGRANLDDKLAAKPGN